MDLRQAEILLEKINRLFKSMKMDETNISRIEKDLMIKYIRDYYELFIPDEEESTPPKPKAKPKPIIRKATPKPVVRDPEFDAIPDEEPEVVTPEPVTPTPPPAPRVIRQQPAPVIKEKPPVVESVVEPAPSPTPIVVKESKPQPVATSTTKVKSTSAIKDEHAALFKKKKATDLADKLSTLPITNLTQAFSINDRILTQNDLFDGDTLGFNVTLENLNGLNNIEEAKVYLSQNVVDKYDWTAKNKVKSARAFIQLVSRRYQ